MYFTFLDEFDVTLIDIFGLKFHGLWLCHMTLKTVMFHSENQATKLDKLGL